MDKIKVAKKNKYSLKELKYLNKFILKYKFRFFLGLCFVFTANYFIILSADIIKDAFDEIEQRVNAIKQSDSTLSIISDTQIHSVLIKYALLILLFALIRGGFMFLMRQTVIIVSRLIEYDLKNNLYDHYLSLSQSFFRRNNTGDLMNRITEDVSKVRMYLGPSIMYAMNTFSIALLVCIAMFQENVKLAVYCLLPMPLLAIAIYFISREINKRSEIIQKKLSDISTLSQEVFSSIRTIKSYVREKYFTSLFNQKSTDYKNFTIQMVQFQAFFFPSIFLLIGLSILFLVYVGGNEIIAGNATPGTIAAFVVYINQLTFPMMALGWVVGLIQRAIVSQGRLNDFLKEKPDIKPGNYIPPNGELKGNIVCKNVAYTHPISGIKSLGNINLEIKAGEFVVFIGPSGSGKTTLIELLFRIYDTDEGEILIDNIPLKKWDLKYVRQRMSYVEQNTVVFSDTIKNNITWSLLNDVEDIDIEKILKASSLKKDIESLENELETQIGERGIMISGGQKQRLALSRALIREPDILVMDDVFSAIDAITEREIIDGMLALRKNKTTILSTHRLYVSKYADKIYCLENGKIVEQGTYEELMKLEGVYKTLYEKQMDADNIIESRKQLLY